MKRFSVRESEDQAVEPEQSACPASATILSKLCQPPGCSSYPSDSIIEGRNTVEEAAILSDTEQGGGDALPVTHDEAKDASTLRAPNSATMQKDIVDTEESKSTYLVQEVKEETESSEKSAVDGNIPNVDNAETSVELVQEHANSPGPISADDCVQNDDTEKICENSENSEISSTTINVPSDGTTSTLMMKVGEQIEYGHLAANAYDSNGYHVLPSSNNIRTMNNLEQGQNLIQSSSNIQYPSGYLQSYIQMRPNTRQLEATISSNSSTQLTQYDVDKLAPEKAYTGGQIRELTASDVSIAVGSIDIPKQATEMAPDAPRQGHTQRSLEPMFEDGRRHSNVSCTDTTEMYDPEFHSMSIQSHFGPLTDGSPQSSVQQKQTPMITTQAGYALCHLTPGQDVGINQPGMYSYQHLPGVQSYLSKTVPPALTQEGSDFRHDYSTMNHDGSYIPQYMASPQTLNAWGYANNYYQEPCQPYSLTNPAKQLTPENVQSILGDMTQGQGQCTSIPQPALHSTPYQMPQERMANYGSYTPHLMPTSYGQYAGNARLIESPGYDRNYPRQRGQMNMKDYYQSTSNIEIQREVISQGRTRKRRSPATYVLPKKFRQTEQAYHAAKANYSHTSSLVAQASNNMRQVANSQLKPLAPGHQVSLDNRCQTTSVYSSNLGYEASPRTPDKARPYVMSPDKEAWPITGKGLIIKYIDYLIKENEHITEMSKTFTPPSDLFLEEDVYFIDSIKKKSGFPSNKFMHFISSYYPNVDTRSLEFSDIQNSETAQYITALLSQPKRNPQELVNQTFFFFQTLKGSLEKIGATTTPVG